MRPIEHSISFQSVEFPPIPLFRMLSEKHPDVSISLRYLNAASSEFQHVYIYRGVVNEVPDPSELSGREREPTVLEDGTVLPFQVKLVEVLGRKS